MNEKSIFLIITYDKYPDGDAGAVRTHSFAKMCEAIGLKPIVIGMGKCTDFKYSTYDGITYCSLRYPKNNYFDRLKGYVFFYSNVLKEIRTFDLDSICGILYVSRGNKLLKKLKKISKSQNVPLYHDSVEWYSASEFKNGVRNFAYKSNNHLNEVLIDQSIKVFAISSFLEQYFVSKGISVLRIPVVMDIEKFSYDIGCSEDDKIRIVYAGMPGRKDRLKELIVAIGKLSAEERAKLSVKIIGITREKYIELYGDDYLNMIKKTVSFEGRKPREQVVEDVKKADFAFLLRPSEERYAKAGFPTKVVESLAAGTAMLCNLSSDLACYLKEDYNSVIIESCTAEACLKALKKIVSYDSKKIMEIKANARKTAEEHFDYRLYVPQCSSFLK